MMFADDIVLCGGKEYRGMRVSRPKTQFMDFTHGTTKPTFKISRDEYRRGMWYGNGDHKTGGSRLKKCSGVLCDRRMPAKLKVKVYKTVTRPAILHWQKRELQRRNTKVDGCA